LNETVAAGLSRAIEKRLARSWRDGVPHTVERMDRVTTARPCMQHKHINGLTATSSTTNFAAHAANTSIKQAAAALYDGCEHTAGSD
jgi:hypothetical protein